MRLALISAVFHEGDPEGSLRKILLRAREAGGELAVLPEIPLNPWSPATQDRREEDAEEPLGPRCELQRNLAREVGIGIVGGVIERDSSTGIRHNTALVIDAAGELIAKYAKVHLPEEPGFWETSHYSPGQEFARPVSGFEMPFGVQICSDNNRPEGTHALAAQGAQLVVAPRATELATYERWKLVFRANALTGCVFIVSVNRPKPEQGVEIGGPSIAVSPLGEVLVETTDTLALVDLDPQVVVSARTRYPGYLPENASLYSDAWREAARRTPRDPS